jgi:protoheme IX farnesyltransferase
MRQASGHASHDLARSDYRRHVQHVSSAEARHRALPCVPRRLSGLVALTKPRIIELLLVTTVPAMFVASRSVPSFQLVAMTVIGGTFAAGGANAFNMFYDRDIDAVMDRTRRRPLVSGAVSPSDALVLSAGLEVSAFVLLWLTVNLLSALLALAAALFYVGVYTVWMKRRYRSNIVIGGAAGAVPALVGWSAVTGHLGAPAWVMFGIVFAWTPPHFWALAIRHRDDYSRASVPMLPSVVDTARVVREILAYSAAVTALSVLLVFVSHLGWVFFGITVALDAGLFYYALALRSDQSPRRAMQLFAYSITYLSALFLAMGAVAVVRHP